jgi:hypothetical protein
MSPKNAMTNPLPRKVTKVVQFCILQLVIQYPGIKLREIKSEVSYLLQVELDESTISPVTRPHQTGNANSCQTEG